MTLVLTRYEAARVMGLRSLQLSEGSQANVTVADERLRQNFRYVAALELFKGVLDAQIRRNGTVFHVRDARFPACVTILLDTEDGGNRVSCR